MSTPEGERLALLHEWQRYYNMSPRPDSRLTQMFVEGLCPLPVDEVARELMCTDFIFKQTLYGETIEEFMKIVAARLKKRYRITWTATWTIVRFYAPIALKLICLSSSLQRIPDRMPEDAC